MRFALALVLVAGFASIAQACDRCGNPRHIVRERSREIVQEEQAFRDFGQQQTVIDDHREIIQGRIITPFREERVLNNRTFESFDSFEHVPRQREIIREREFHHFPRREFYSQDFSSFQGFQRASFFDSGFRSFRSPCISTFSSRGFGGCGGGGLFGTVFGGPVIGSNGLVGRILGRDRYF